MISTRAIAAILSIVGLSACYKEQIVTIQPREYFTGPHAVEMTVIRKDGQVAQVKSPTVEKENITWWQGRKEVSIPVADIQTIKFKTMDKGKTFLLVGGLAAGAGAIVAVTAGGGKGDVPCVGVDPRTCMMRTSPGVSVPVSSVAKAFSGLTRVLSGAQ